MASNAGQAAQPVQDRENEEKENPIPADGPSHKSSVYRDPFAQAAATKFRKDDEVHMSIVANGTRRRGVFKIYMARSRGPGYGEYQLIDNYNQLYDNGAWVKERDLRMNNQQGGRS